ncbi:MAG: hypothetical protein E6R12_04530 [Sphingomonadales bacterium]|nr:MAG: hypothetical protein E6R12_04530 [Sphingomonadales bacterium]
MSEYTVGKGRPPRNWRFKPGQSGNPGGRPKKKPGIDVLSLLDQPVTVVQDGRAVEMQPGEVALRKLVRRALKDRDRRSILHLLDLFIKYDALHLPSSLPGGGVLNLPSDMPWRLATLALRRLGTPPWTSSELASVRAEYLADRSEDERLLDESLERLTNGQG